MQRYLLARFSFFFFPLESIVATVGQNTHQINCQKCRK